MLMVKVVISLCEECKSDESLDTLHFFSVQLVQIDGCLLQASIHDS